MSSFNARLLPWVKSRLNVNNSAGWLIKTCVKDSLIPNCGYGRFSLQNVPKNEIVCKKRIISVNNSSIDEIFNDNYCILLKNLNDLKLLVNIWKNNSLNKESEKEIISTLNHFIVYNINDINKDNNKCIIHGITTCMNHSFTPNIQWYQTETHEIGKALNDIKENEELFEDYSVLNQPKWYLDFCKENGIEDVSQFAINLKNNV